VQKWLPATSALQYSVVPGQFSHPGRKIGVFRGEFRRSSFDLAVNGKSRLICMKRRTDASKVIVTRALQVERDGEAWTQSVAFAVGLKIRRHRQLPSHNVLIPQCNPWRGGLREQYDIRPAAARCSLICSATTSHSIPAPHTQPNIVIIILCHMVCLAVG
jgi:hypothetical protein